MPQDQILLKLLEDAGLPPKEASVYLALLELSKGNVKEISRMTGLKMPIIYVILESLIKRGYISELPNKKINTYQPSDPSIIGSKLSLVAKNFNDMIPIMRTLANKDKSKPKISYYDTKDAIWTVYNEVNNYKNAFFITSLSRIENIFPGSISAWEKSYRNKYNKLESRNLIPNNQVDIEIIQKFKSITDKVQGRIFRDYQDFNIDLAIYDTKVSIASFSDHPFLVIIDSDELVKTLMPFFNLAWNQSKEV